jgi:hypothetical protein
VADASGALLGAVMGEVVSHPRYKNEENERKKIMGEFHGGER